MELHNLRSSGLINIVSDVRHSEVKAGIGKYSKFNRDFIYGQKYRMTNEGIKGMFDTPMVENINNENVYPYEVFFRENKSKL
jgi:hypothetical protein